MRRLVLPARRPRRVLPQLSRRIPRQISRQISRQVSRRGVGVALAVTALVLGSLAAAVAVLAVRIDGPSMTPALRDGERVLVRPFSGGDAPDRFAVVVGRFTRGGPLVVKRVIALPGDRVSMDTTGVRVQPGGQGRWLAVGNPAWGTAGPGGACCRPDGRATAQAEPAVVPAGMLFLLGDSPGASQDSRAFGWAPIALVEGVVGWRVYPPGRIGGVGVDVELVRPPR